MPLPFWLLSLVLSLALAPVSAQTPTPSWPQFRQSPALRASPTGLPAADDCDATRAAVESSAAIVDNVACIGTGNGELLALDAATARSMEVSGRLPRHRHRIVVAGSVWQLRLCRRSEASCTRWTRHWHRAWTFKTGGEIKSSPVVTGDRARRRDGHSMRSIGPPGSSSGSTDGQLRACDAGTSQRHRLLRRPRRGVSRRARGGWVKAIEMNIDAARVSPTVATGSPTSDILQ